MGKSNLEIEENMIADGVKSRSTKDGYFVTKRVMLLCAILVIFLCLTIGLLAAYFGPGQQDTQASGTVKDFKTTPNTSGTTKAPVPTTIGNEPYNNIRLPKHVIPIHYDVYLNVDMGYKEVAAATNITVNVTKATKYFIIHAFSFRSISGTIKDVYRNKVLNPKRQFTFEKNHYHVSEFDEEVPAGIYQLDFDVDYNLRRDLKGFYQSSYKTKEGVKKFVAATQFEPVDARTAFPCFDEPAMKATFSITIKHTPNYIALSNMPIISSVMTDGKLLNTFEKSKIMPTYLLAFVICDFGNKTTTTDSSNPVKMTYYAPKEQIDQIDYAMTVGKQILPFFEDYYGLPYPLPKADMIAIPDFAAGAMENWGLITYRAKALLYDTSASSISNKVYIASVVSHELAHQWFGNIVTMEWWSDLWLNEGFASYVEYLGVNATHPDWQVIDFQVISDMATAFSLDALVTSHPIYIEVKHPDEINEIFDSISYAKGGSILRMLDNFIGNNVFVKGLKIYLKRYSYGNARTNDLWNALSEATRANGGKGYNVSEIMNTWILQMGFPYVNVTRNKDGTYGLDQERFLADPKPDFSKSKFRSPYEYKWMIPFNYIILNISDINNTIVVEEKTTIMNMTSGIITLPSSSPNLIVKGNAKQFGFFRVNYDIDGWKNINRVLQNNHNAFDVKDRAGLLSDAFALANSGKLDYAVALDLMSYIDKDMDYLPWRAARDAISYIPSVLTRTRPAKELYSKYMLKKVSSLYEKYAFKDVSNHLERYLQVLIVGQACGNGHKGCLSNATKLFKDFMTDPKKNAIPADFRSMVYYYGVYSGGEKEWDFLYKRYLKNKIATEKTKLLYGMAAIQEPWMINRYLQMGLDESIVKSQDVSYVFSYVSNSNSNGRYLAWNFLKDNWPAISKRFRLALALFFESATFLSPFSFLFLAYIAVVRSKKYNFKFSQSFFTMRRIFSSVTSGFTTQYELDQLIDFVNTKVADLGTAKRIVTQSEEKIKATIAWLKKNEKTVQKWFEQQNQA